jgi:tetratricopeptide (TPR) repeat protein
MRKTPLLAAVIVLSAAIGAPDIGNAIEGANPAPPPNPQPSGTNTAPPSNSQRSGTSTSSPSSSQPSDTTTPKPKTKTQKSKPQNSGSLEDFYEGWHKAYALVYDNADYTGGIAVLHSMGYDDNADVATLIGYASRKLGRYDDAKYWYDKALAADPNHAQTWSYYGMWHAEQGNLLKAKDDLEKVRTICGTECREFVELKEVIDGTRTY